MKLTLPRLVWPTWSRTSSGENFYDITSMEGWAGSMTNLELAQCHPILSPAILFVAKLFSQAEFSVETANGDKKDTSELINLLDNPNQFQTREDFLETLMFMMIAQGVGIVYRRKILGFENTKSMFVLDKDLITWPEEYNKLPFRKNLESHLNKKIVYDKDGENIIISIKDLMFFYDLPNMMNRNPFDVKSRVDGLRQTLINTVDSLIAKNIILKSNGKELITGKKEGFPMSPEEKTEVENLFNNKLGLAFNRKRGVITKADVTWKSLHIALRDLGLDESIKIDGNLIYTALHIPKDILSLEAKKTTYNNFKESMVSYIQNEMQASINSFVSVLNKAAKSKEKLIGDYNHLPIMQFILLEKYEVVTKQAAALRALLMVGVPEKVALEMCGFDKNLELEEMQMESNGTEQETETQEAKLNGYESIEYLDRV